MSKYVSIIPPPPKKKNPPELELFPNLLGKQHMQPITVLENFLQKKLIN
jgi:hypothetical protein